MWCPKCRNEYIEGVTTCVDCGCELVDELPKEIDKEAPQVIGSVIDEEIGNKFLRFFRFSGLKTCALLPHNEEEEEGFYLVVSYDELEPAVQLVQQFAEAEEIQNSKDLDLDKLVSILDDHLDDIQDEEANELLTDLRTESSTVYVNKKDKYTDFKFSGYSFITFAVLGYVFVAINFAGVIHLFNYYSMAILGIVFTVFLGIGISSLRKASRIKGLVSEEETILEQVQEFIEREFTDEYFDTLGNSELSDEENFLHVSEGLKNRLVEQFPLFSKGYIDQLVDEKYGDYCDRKFDGVYEEVSVSDEDVESETESVSEAEPEESENTEE